MTKADRARRGAALREARALVGLSQESLASRMGIHAVTVANWEGGRYAMTLETLEALERAIGARVAFFDAAGQQLATAEQARAIESADIAFLFDET